MYDECMLLGCVLGISSMNKCMVNVCHWGNVGSCLRGINVCYWEYVGSCLRRINVWWNVVYESVISLVNSSPPGQNGCHFADAIFRCISVNEKFCILIWVSLNFVPMGLIGDMSQLVEVMAWSLTSHKPLPEPLMAHFTDAYIRH